MLCFVSTPVYVWIFWVHLKRLAISNELAQLFTMFVTERFRWDNYREVTRDAQMYFLVMWLWIYSWIYCSICTKLCDWICSLLLCVSVLWTYLCNKCLSLIILCKIQFIRDVSGYGFQIIVWLETDDSEKWTLGSKNTFDWFLLIVLFVFALFCFA